MRLPVIFVLISVMIDAMGVGLIISSTGSLLLIGLSGLLLGVGAAISTPCSTAILAKMSPPDKAPLIFSSCI